MHCSTSNASKHFNYLTLIIGDVPLLEIDGSYGEGGGQILRTAVALSAFTKIPIKIINIRANRPNPGIKPQHYIAIKSVKKLCDAETTGLEIGSSTLAFIPRGIKGGKCRFDIGTAGSITLVFQACILASLKTKEPITIKVTGGTDVKWSPSWFYIQHVFQRLLQKTGIKIDTRLIKRGYYPKGGGEAEITIYPVKKIHPLQLEEIPQYSEIKGVVHIANLPDHISTRIKHAVIKTLLKKDTKSSIKIEQTTALSPGTGITLWTQSRDTVLGSAILGERDVASEEIGEKAALNLLREIESDATLDVYAFDQLLPYMAIARKNGTSTCFVREISNHAQTNMWLIQKFFDVKFEAKQEEKNIKITVK